MKPKRLIVLLSSAFLVLAGCGGTSTASTASPGASQDLHRFAGQTLTVGIFFEDFGTRLAQWAGPAFESATGAKLNWLVAASNINVDKLVASQGSAPPFDAIITDYSTVAPAIKLGLMAQANYNNIPNAKTAYPGTAGKWGPFLWYYIPAICYRTDKYQQNGITPPTSLDAVLDPAVQGHISWPASDVGLSTTGLVQTLLGNGFPINDPTPYINKYKSIKAVSYASTELDMMAALQSGGAWIAPYGNYADCTRIRIDNGVPIGIAPYNLHIGGKTYPYTGSAVAIEFAKGPNQALAEAFANFLLDPSGKGVLYAVQKYTLPTTIPAAQQQLLADPATAQRVFQNPAQLYVTWDPFAFVDHQSAWISAWNRAFK